MTIEDSFPTVRRYAITLNYDDPQSVGPLLEWFKERFELFHSGGQEYSLKVGNHLQLYGETIYGKTKADTNRLSTGHLAKHLTQREGINKYSFATARKDREHNVRYTTKGTNPFVSDPEYEHLIGSYVELKNPILRPADKPLKVPFFEQVMDVIEKAGRPTTLVGIHEALIATTVIPWNHFSDSQIFKLCRAVFHRVNPRNSEQMLRAGFLAELNHLDSNIRDYYVDEDVNA